MASLLLATPVINSIWFILIALNDRFAGKKGDAKSRRTKLNPIEAFTGLVANAVLWMLRWGRRMSEKAGPQVIQGSGISFPKIFQKAFIIMFALFNGS